MPEKEKPPAMRVVSYLFNNINYTVPSNSTINDNDSKLYEDVADIKTSKIFEFFQTTWNTAFDGLVKCNLLSEEWKVFLINLNIGKYEVFHSDWMADFNLASCFSMLYTTGNGCNYSFCSDSKVDKLYKDSLLAKNSADYLKMQKELARIIMNSYVSIPYCGQKFSRLVSNKIGGFDFVNNNLDSFSSRDLFFK